MPALLAVLGCAPKADVVQAPTPMDVATVAVMEPLDDPRVQPVPDAVMDALGRVLSERNLTMQPVEPATWEDAFSRGRTARFRVAHVALGTEAPLVLVVSTFSRYGSQLHGRYRWTVQVEAALAPAATPEDAIVSEFSVPVFLQFHHQRDADAVEAAIPVIERQVGHLLDQVLGGMEAP
ncbi:MAG: hypothetical protein D6798_10715 [Deltaproteobacteria bacterium]|nr:MAG: hypothetical protein D6798_10715 [Deltaproteobacteria bacterium]